jgi:ornithine decarboxylase
MPGPFLLPEDVCEGDWIALKGMGAYMAASQSRFNGFYSDSQVEIADESMAATPIRRRSQRGSHLKLVKNDQSVEQ